MNIQVDKVKRAVNAYRDTCENSSRWEFANQILYDLCSEHLTHNKNEEDQIAAKIWLIGRSYAAAIERRKNAKGFKGDFYYDSVVPAMIEIGTDLDLRIASLNAKSISFDTVDDVLDTHLLLMNKFEELTKLNKRSLASKYLHFHCPNMVFIYDSFASAALRDLVKKDRKLVQQHQFNNRDNEYVDFCVRSLELKNYILNTYHIDLSLRQLDNLLLNYQKIM